MIDRAELDLLCQIAMAAGQEIMAIYNYGGDVWHKADDSPLSEADLRADRLIRQSLERNFPGVFILSEESASIGPYTGNRFFLVDPLDGTKEFLARNGEFTVNIALVENESLSAGIVMAPALDELFYAARGLGAWKRDTDGQHSIATSDYAANRPLRAIGSRSHGGDRVDAWLSNLRCEHTFFAVGSSLKFCRIAEGRADIYPRLGPTNQWDTAAGQAVLEIAGGTVRNMEGDILSYELDRQILNTEFVALANSALIDVALCRH